MNQKVLYLKGLPASGKSTYAKSLVADTFNKWYRANKDTIRVWIRGHYENLTRSEMEKMTIEQEDTDIRVALIKGYNVVVDDTNFNPIHEKRIRKIVEDYAANTRNIVEFEVKFFDVPLEECLRRNRERQGDARVPDKVITDMYNKYLKPKRPDAPERVIGARDAIIVDLDGTLALFEGSPYDRDFSKDIRNEPVARFIRDMFWDDYDVIITSGRNDKFRKVTEDWLDYDNNNIPYTHLYMRKDGDFRKDSEIKLDIYNNHIKGKYNVYLVLDDRNQVVELWRSLGLTCWQVADGNF